MFRYAQLDEDKKVMGLSDLSGEIDYPDMILLGEDSDVALGDIYDPNKNTFIRPEPEPEEEREKVLSLEDLYKGQLAVMQALTDMYLKGSGAMDMDIPDIATDGGGN